MRVASGVVVACALLLAGCTHVSEQTLQAQQKVPKAPQRSGDIVRFDTDSPQLSRIRVEAVELSDVPMEQVIAPGKVELNPGRVSRIALPVAGRIREVNVMLGDQIRQGDTVLTLESQEISAVQSALRQAEASVSQAKASVAKAQADLDRAKDLFAKSAIAQKEVLAAETVVTQAKASLEQAMASRDEAQRKMALLGLHDGTDTFINVHAPVSGKVTEIAAVAGEYRSDTAAPVLTIADLSTVWVSADVPESAIRFIQPGERVSITLPAFPDRTFTGQVKRIGDAVDPATRTIKVRAELSNPEGQLKPEMFAQICHDHGTRKLPTISKAAILQQEGRTVVYVERGRGQFQEVAVTLGWAGADRVAISKGVGPKDRVVVDGTMLLKGASQ